MPDEAEYQPQNSIFAANILPDQLSAVSLSGGRTVPHTFYLGPNNTVPFIRLESPVASKIISWGETITLQPGANVNVRNVSYMPGDLEIQSGTQPCPVPPRVTIPVKGIVTFTGPNSLTVAMEYPCDTRKARRAWLAINLQDPQQDNLQTPPITETVYFVTVTGSMRLHTQPTPPIPGRTDVYRDLFELREEPRIIPLGVSLEGNAMRLVDSAEVVITQSWGAGYSGEGAVASLQDTCCYILEY